MLPKLKVKFGEGVGVQLFIPSPELSGTRRTFLSADSAVGASSYTVENGTGFSISEYILVGAFGSEKSEIDLLHSSTTPTATVLTTNAVTTFAHNRGDIVQFIPYNQIKIERSTDGGVNYSALATIDIRADASETLYVDTGGLSTYYYKVKFYNATSTLVSEFSDVVIATGYAYNSVHAIKSRALSQLGEKIGAIITDEFLNESLWEARREVDKSIKRWSFRTSFNTDIGNITEGQWSVAVPATLRNPDSPQNILSLKLGTRGTPLPYLDKREFDSYYEGVIRTTIATQPSVGQTTLVLANVRDLAESGSVMVAGDVITYTSKDDSTATLSGIPASSTGSITVAHAVGVNAWQNASFGEPTAYTIFEDAIFFNSPFNETLDGSNIFMDYYRTLPDYDSDADTLDEPSIDMYVSYLKYRIKSLKKKGELKRDNDDDYKDYVQKIGSMIRKEVTSQGVKMVPQIQHLSGQD